VHLEFGNGSKFPRINFCSNIVKLKLDFTKLTLKLGYHPTKWMGKNIMIYRKEDIFKYWYEVGFSNPYHTNRFRSIAPIV